LISFIWINDSILNAPECKACIPYENLSDTYDYIVVGGGTAGSVVAAKLSEDPSSTVLLIESGGYVNDNTISLQSIPGVALLNLATGLINLGWQSEPQETPLKGSAGPGVAGRKIPIPRGKGLGGSNELNFMLHVMPSEGDLDTWASASGDDSWNSSNMFHLLDEYELRESEINSTTGEAIGNGVIGITKATEPHELISDLIEASGKTPHGKTDEYNSYGKRLGAAEMEFFTKNAVRQSTAREFLVPHIKTRPNLHVLLKSQVTGLLLENAPATEASEGSEKAGGIVARGVKVVCKDAQVFGEDTVVTNLRARKEVILSAGAYATPQILMLSGIGPKSHLDDIGIPTVVDLPVGNNLQDHPFFPIKVCKGIQYANAKAMNEFCEAVL
jgi:choline dehydrogenase-like flavoprotein